MYDFSFSIPTEIHFGRNCEEQVGALMKRYADKVMLLYGSQRVFDEGLGERILHSLENAGCETVLMGGVKPNADVRFIRRAIEKVRAENVQGLLAVGGGSVIDSAKAVSAGSAYDGDVMELYAGGGSEPEIFLPIGAVVTIPATASESNEMSVISDSVTGKKVARPFPQVKPKFAILNPELTLTVSPYQTACGGFDMFAHAFERYVDMRRGSLLLDAMTEGLMKTVVQVLPKVIEKPDDVALRGELMLAATVAHNDMLGPGGDFACHEMSHLITEKFGITHGGALAMIIPAWCRFMRNTNKERLAQLFSKVWGAGSGDAACTGAAGDTDAVIEEGIAAMEKFIGDIGLPLNFREADIIIEEADLEVLAVATLDGRPFIGGGFAEVGKDDIREIYRLFML